MRANRRSGFTLVEIMVVVVIIGILATLVIARVVGRSDEARVKTTKALLVSVAGQLDIFKLNHGRYPDSLDELMHAPSWLQDPKTFPPEGYLRELPVDAWSNKLIYRKGTAANKPFELLSYGADGREGGDQYDADLSY
jgi:general secretion pathway protein G